jgi:hypothetical protein
MFEEYKNQYCEMINKITQLITFAYFNTKSQKSKASYVVARSYGKKTAGCALQISKL